MKWIRSLIYGVCLLAGPALAQSPVKVTVANSPGYAIPADFSGLSFETGSERPGNAHTSGYMFSATNSQLVTLFQNTGLKNIRIGGGSVDNETPPGFGRDGLRGVDNLFAFAQSAGVNVIYSLRLLGSTNLDFAGRDTVIARYIWEHYRAWLSCFSIGNEPDWKSYHHAPFGAGPDPAITNYPGYLADWNRVAATVIRAAPGATFAGPDTGSYSQSTDYRGRSWTGHFAMDEASSGLVALVTQHFYVGGNPYILGTKQFLPARRAIDNLLSPGWDTVTNQWLYDHILAPVVAQGLPYRLTESNDYLLGVTNASDAFAAALWALDYMHWWAAHHCAGVNFHNKQWLRTDTLQMDAQGNYQISPKAYGLKAFDLGGHGQEEPVTVTKAANLNLTVYAVGTATNLYVTLINKEHGAGARAAAVSILPRGISSGAVSVMILTAPNGDPGATTGITLGGAPITNHAPWSGHWTTLSPVTNGQCAVTVPPASAAIVKISGW